MRSATKHAADAFTMDEYLAYSISSTTARLLEQSGRLGSHDKIFARGGVFAVAYGPQLPNVTYEPKRFSVRSGVSVVWSYADDRSNDLTKMARNVRGDSMPAPRFSDFSTVSFENDERAVNLLRVARISVVDEAMVSVKIWSRIVVGISMGGGSFWSSDLQVFSNENTYHDDWETGPSSALVFWDRHGGSGESLVEGPLESSVSLDDVAVANEIPSMIFDEFSKVCDRIPSAIVMERAEKAARGGAL